MASIMPVANETHSSVTRVTREGRTITYQMNVVQKPERARACGQGAKSSSDRRPVDPPPIVDLRILEGGERRDITFTYNANFFLFATLEHARPIAQGRMPQQQSNQPVLTGTPVAGMAYLDRPQPAGYFIFPDLSVRHEGRYRLIFTLYEEIKDPKDDNPEHSRPNQAAGTAQAEVHGRCEVKSEPFSVFSAKKFPGLTESTSLSRTVADQGCRVRIRRDVRMRRRNEKNKDWEDFEDETAHLREARSVTPPGQRVAPAAQAGPDPADRPRSVSNASNASYQIAPRRPSNQEAHPHYSHGYIQPADVHQQAHHQPYGQQPTYDQPHMPPQYSHSYMHQQHMAPPQPPMPQYHQQQPYGYPHHHQQQQPMGPPTYGYMPPQPQQQAPPPPMQHQMYEQPLPHMRQDSVDYSAGPPNYQRGSVGLPPYNHQASQITTPLGTVDNGYGRPLPPPTSSTPSHQHQPMYQASPTGSLAPSKALPPLNKTLDSHHTSKFEPASPLTPSTVRASPTYDRTPAQTYMPAQSTSKRPFGSTFSTHHMNEPLRGGARPNTLSGAGLQDGSDASDEDFEFETLRMNYRRADGSRVVREWRPQGI